MQRILLSVLAVCLIGWGAAAGYIYADYAEAAKIRASNAARTGAANQREKDVKDLEEARPTVQVVHARLVDSTVTPELAAPVVAAIPGQPRPVSAAAAPFRLPAPLEALQREGIEWKFGGRELAAGDRARGVRAETSAEFHRLLPVLVSLENSYALVLTDELALALPSGSVPFSSQPVRLQVQALFRVPLRLPSAVAKSR